MFYQILVCSSYPRITVQPKARAWDLTSIRSSVHLSMESNTKMNSWYFQNEKRSYQLSRVSGSSELLIRSSNLTDRALTVPPEML